MSKCVNCGNNLPSNTVIYLSEPQEPFCQDCSDANVCKEEIDAKCVVYHSDNAEPSKLTALDMPNLSTAEEIFEAIDDLIQNGLNLPIKPIDTKTIDITATGPAKHTIKADVILSEIDGQILHVLDDGLYASGETSVPEVDNGLRIQGDEIYLGGGLVENTTIDLNGFTLNLLDGNVGFKTSSPTKNISVEEKLWIYRGAGVLDNQSFIEIPVNQELVLQGACPDADTRFLAIKPSALRGFFSFHNNFANSGEYYQAWISNGSVEQGRIGGMSTVSGDEFFIKSNTDVSLVLDDSDEGSFFRIAEYGSANVGDVLKLVDPATGEIEWSNFAGGGLIQVDKFIANGNYNKPAGCKFLIVITQGAGGGGGGVSGSAVNAAAAGGGGAGGFAIHYLNESSVSNTEAITIGNAGAGGTAGNNNGSVGGSTSFGSLITVTGGSGGTGMAFGTTANVANGGSTGVLSVTTGTILGQGGNGGSAGLRLSDSAAVCGVGGSGYYNGSPIATGASGNGLSGNATGGTGGNGAVSTDGNNYAGGNGQPGFVLVYSYA